MNDTKANTSGDGTGLRFEEVEGEMRFRCPGCGAVVDVIEPDC